MEFRDEVRKFFDLLTDQVIYEIDSCSLFNETTCLESVLSLIVHLLLLSFCVSQYITRNPYFERISVVLNLLFKLNICVLRDNEQCLVSGS